MKPSAVGSIPTVLSIDEFLEGPRSWTKINKHVGDQNSPDLRMCERFPRQARTTGS
jgi:hypothetical protein